MINFREHFELQDRLNRVINPDWLTAGYRWSDAAMVEAVEAFDHLAWKWWKHGTDNMPQFRLELVDIWHFIVSDMLTALHPGSDPAQDRTALAESCEWHVRNHNRHAESGGLKDMLRVFIVSCAEGVLPIGVFFRLCELADLSLPELDRMYRAKGVLNLFRQANGYKDGSYVKMWAGREDSVWLDALMATTPDATADQLMDKLARIYHDVIPGASNTAIARTLVGDYWREHSATPDPDIARSVTELGRTILECLTAKLGNTIVGMHVAVPVGRPLEPNFPIGPADPSTYHVRKDPRIGLTVGPTAAEIAESVAMLPGTAYCQYCSGLGRVEPAGDGCPDCNGTGTRNCAGPAC